MLPNVFSEPSSAKDIREEIGWSEEVTDHYLSAQIMRLCSYIGTLERRVADLEEVFKLEETSKA